MDISKWNLSKLPPEGHEDVGPYFWKLFRLAEDERDRLRLPDIWRENYKLWRGEHWGTRKKANDLSLNLFFANVQRTVANVTARKPVAECVDLDGTSNGLDKVGSARLKKWWKESNQQAKLQQSCQKDEVNGITVEKAFWNADQGQPGVVVVDPYAIFPAPGNWDDFTIDPPYIAHAYPEPVAGVEAFYEVEGVKPSDMYSLLGEYREEDRPVTVGTRIGAINHESNPHQTVFATTGDSESRENRALVVEVWVREKKCKKYPDGIRVVTLTNDGDLVLDDKPNPNINWELPIEKSSTTYLFGRFPFYKINSYEDSESHWGFSAADQVADLVVILDEFISKLVNYVKRSMAPILILPPGHGITRNQLSNKPGLVLEPQTAEAAAGIRYLPQPSLSNDIYKVMDMLVAMFDRIYAIQDADRGSAPNGVVAASAIVELQERNAVLIQHKINAVDYLVEQRGNMAISLFQNHGHKAEEIEVDEEVVQFSGISLVGHKFQYVVEAGSTIPKTSLQVQEQALALADKGHIDSQALLETINFPNHKRILERMGENQLDAAFNILIQAGLPEETAMELAQYLSQPQGGPGDSPSVGYRTPQPGTPVAQQGRMQ